MSSDSRTTDPTVGVAQASVATISGIVGGHIFTAEDVPSMLREGKSVDEVACLGLTDRETVERIAAEQARERETRRRWFGFRRR